MAVIVDVYQDKRKTGNNLWYGRAWHPGVLDTRALAKRIEQNVWHPGVLDTRALAKRIEQNVSVKESDVYAVLIELANVMTYEIQNGNKCKLDRFGYFGVSLRSSGALTEADFSIKEHIKNAKCIFTPEYTRDGAGEGSKLQSRALGAKGDFQFVIKNPVPKP